MTRKHAPDGRCCDVEAKFRCCSRHGRVTTCYIVETSMARNIRHQTLTCWKFAGPVPWTPLNCCLKLYLVRCLSIQLFKYSHQRQFNVENNWQCDAVICSPQIIIAFVSSYLLDNIALSKLHQCAYCSWCRVEFAHSVLINHLPVPASVRVERRPFKLHSHHIIGSHSVTATDWHHIPPSSAAAANTQIQTMTLVAALASGP